MREYTTREIEKNNRLHGILTKWSLRVVCCLFVSMLLGVLNHTVLKSILITHITTTLILGFSISATILFIWYTFVDFRKTRIDISIAISHMERVGRQRLEETEEQFIDNFLEEKIKVVKRNENHFSEDLFKL